MADVAESDLDRYRIGPGADPGKQMPRYVERSRFFQSESDTERSIFCGVAFDKWWLRWSVRESSSSMLPDAQTISYAIALGINSGKRASSRFRKQIS